ncbi:MAG: hypothetical protein QGH76_03625, partial [Phycisphaerales bacterium]|nr:hypothetical protein [Phycisphaerales bacterium]
MIGHRITQFSPLRRAPLVGCLLSACLGVGVASFTGCNQVYNQLGPFGGVARTLVDDYFGLELNFSIAGAPENNVEQVFFYLSRTSDIATHLHE